MSLSCGRKDCREILLAGAFPCNKKRIAIKTMAAAMKILKNAARLVKRVTVRRDLRLNRMIHHINAIDINS